MLPLITAHFEGRYSQKTAYEMSSYGATYDFLCKHFSVMQFSEYMPGHLLGVTVDGVRNEDATRLTFASESFDVVTSNQVFEHVEDDVLAYSECQRVLKPGGALIFTVPLYDAPTTEQVARLSGTDIEWLGKPEYHDSRIGGPQTAPVFWRHSIHDIASRVSSAGFNAVRVVSVSILKDKGIAQPVIYATK